MTRISSPNAGAIRAWHVAGFIFASSAALASFQFLVGPVITEDLGDLVFYRTQRTLMALASGGLPFWEPRVGLGIPFSNPQDLGFHPLAILFLALPIDVAIALFAFASLAVGQVFVWLLCRRLAIAGTPTLLAVVTYTLSLPTIEYVVFSSYPSILIGWTTLPVLIYLGLVLAEADRVADRLRAAAAFSLAAAFLFMNSHVGMTFGGLVATGFVCLLAASERRPYAGRLAFLAAAALVTMLICADKIFALIDELARFPAETPRSGKFYIRSFYTDAIWHLLFRPLFVPDPSLVWETFRSNGFGPAIGEIAHQYVLRNSDWFINREWLAPFFGPPFFLLAVHAVLERRVRIPHKRALAWTFVLLLLMLPLPPRFTPVAATGTNTFREPLLLLGILLAAGSLTWISRAAAGRSWRFPPELVRLQVAALVVGVFPLMYVTAGQQEFSRSTGFRVQGPARTWLLPAEEKRKLFKLIGPEARVVYFGSRIRQAQLLDAGLSVVTGDVKAINLDALYPSAVKMYGQIPSDEAVIGDHGILDVLAIRYVVADPGTRLPPDLLPVGSVRNSSGAEALVWRNDSAWPRAVFLSGIPDDLPVRESACDKSGLLCRDLGALRQRRSGGDIVVRHEGDAIRLTSPASTEPRTVLLSELFRPGWQAAAGAGPTDVRAALGGLIATTFPAGEREIVLTYRPLARLVARSVGTATVLVALIVLGVASIPARYRLRLGGRLMRLVPVRRSHEPVS